MRKEEREGAAQGGFLLLGLFINYGYELRDAVLDAALDTALDAASRAAWQHWQI